MNNQTIEKSKKNVLPKFEIPSVGVGTMRTSAAWIILMLAAEDEVTRPLIILEVMKHLEMTVEELQEVSQDKACTKCGISLLAHKRNGGKCF